MSEYDDSRVHVKIAIVEFREGYTQKCHCGEVIATGLFGVTLQTDDRIGLVCNESPSVCSTCKTENNTAWFGGQEEDALKFAKVIKYWIDERRVIRRLLWSDLASTEPDVLH